MLNVLCWHGSQIFYFINENISRKTTDVSFIIFIGPEIRIIINLIITQLFHIFDENIDNRIISEVINGISKVFVISIFSNSSYYIALSVLPIIFLYNIGGIIR